MEILFVAPEIAPVLKASALADAVFALSKALRNLGHKVTVAMPRCPAVDAAGLLVARRLTPLALGSTGAVPREAIVFDSRLASGVDLVLFDAVDPADGSFLFDDVTTTDGANLYEKGGIAHPKAALRAAVLCRAAVELAKDRARAGQPFDVIHAHDGWASMALYLAKQAPELEACRKVLTIHDVARQGLFQAEHQRTALGALGLDAEHFVPSRLEFYGGLSFLKGGIVAADVVTALSPARASELLTHEGGARLDGVLGSRADRPVGILGGVDASLFNPATDAALPFRFDADDPSNKGRCKSALLKELGLEIAPERPLFVGVGTLDREGGFDVLADALPKLLLQDVSVVLVGAGDPLVTAALERAMANHTERSKLVTRATDVTVRRALAAADFAIFPGRNEPNAQRAQASLRYGTLPLATRTGAHIDAIVDLDAELETGTGMLFEAASADALLGVVGRAQAAFRSPRFPFVLRRAMRRDVGWERPARRYEQLYRAPSSPRT
jgi:starch synthase